MTLRLERNFKKLERRRRRLLAELEDWPSEQLHFRINSGSWSASDLLEHIRLSEKGVLASMKANLHARRRVTVRDRLRNGFVLAIMVLPTRLKVPDSVPQIIPRGNSENLAALSAAWDHERGELAAFLNNLSSADTDAGLFRHPVGGWTTAAGALLFLRSHLQHHLYQFRRIGKASRKPSRS